MSDTFDPILYARQQFGDHDYTRDGGEDIGSKNWHLEDDYVVAKIDSGIAKTIWDILEENEETKGQSTLGYDEDRLREIAIPVDLLKQLNQSPELFAKVAKGFPSIAHRLAAFNEQKMYESGTVSVAKQFAPETIPSALAWLHQITKLQWRVEANSPTLKADTKISAYMPSQEEFERVREILEQNKIRFSVDTDARTVNLELGSIVFAYRPPERFIRVQTVELVGKGANKGKAALKWLKHHGEKAPDEILKNAEWRVEYSPPPHPDQRVCATTVNVTKDTFAPTIEALDKYFEPFGLTSLGYVADPEKPSEFTYAFPVDAVVAANKNFPLPKTGRKRGEED